MTWTARLECYYSSCTQVLTTGNVSVMVWVPPPHLPPPYSYESCWIPLVDFLKRCLDISNIVWCFSSFLQVWLRSSTRVCQQSTWVVSNWNDSIRLNRAATDVSLNEIIFGTWLLNCTFKTADYLLSRIKKIKGKKKKRRWACEALRARSKTKHELPLCVITRKLFRWSPSQGTFFSCAVDKLQDFCLLWSPFFFQAFWQCLRKGTSFQLRKRH